MGRILRVRTLILASLFCLAATGFALAQTSGSGTVNLTFTVPVHIELTVNDDTVAISSWTFSPAPSVERISFEPALIGQASVANHLTVYSNVADWTLSQQFDSNAFLAAGGHVVIRLTHNISASPTAVFSSTPDWAASYTTNAGQGISTFDAVYYAVAPFDSGVDTSADYSVQVTYTITAL